MRIFSLGMASTCPSLTFVERSATGLRDDPVWWSIYDASLAPWLREPREIVVGSAERGEAIALAARDGETTVGLALVHLLEEPPAVLVLALGLLPELMGQRIGSLLLDEATGAGMRRLRERGLDPWGFAIAAEPPELAASKAQRDQRRKQIAFVRRQGARVLPYPYLQPPVRGTAPAPMRLLFRGEEGRRLRQHELESLVQAIYFEKYGRVNGVDARTLQRLLAPSPPGAAPSFCLPRTGPGLRLLPEPT